MKYNIRLKFKGAAGLMVLLAALYLAVLTAPLPLSAAGQRAEPYESYLTIKYYINLEDYDTAGKLIDRFLETRPDDPFILTEKAMLALKKDRKTKIAEKLLEKARTIYPEYYYSNYLSAYIILNNYPDDKDKVERALGFLKTSIRDNSGFYDSYYWLGVILNEQGKPAESNRYFEKANRLSEKPATYYYMASNYRKLKDETGEIKALKSLLEMNPTNHRALVRLGQLYLDQKDYSAALPYFERLYSSNPENRQVFAQYLYSLFAAGKDKKFLEVAQSGMVADSPMLSYAKALILRKRKKFDEAIDFLKEIKNKDTRTSLLLSGTLYQ